MRDKIQETICSCAPVFLRRNIAMRKFLTASAMLTTASVLSAADPYDVIIRNGIIYDGSGNKPFAGDVAINGQRIARSEMFRRMPGRSSKLTPKASLFRRASSTC
jgi:hypothetical protein